MVGAPELPEFVALVEGQDADDGGKDAEGDVDC